MERIDLKTDDGRARLGELLAAVDVFVSSQRPSALARLGLTPQTLAHTRWVNIVGDTSAPEIPGHDLTYQARAGLLTEAMPVSLFADVMGSERAFSAVLLTLRQPPGTHLEVGLFDSLGPLVLRRSTVSRRPVDRLRAACRRMRSIPHAKARLRSARSSRTSARGSMPCCNYLTAPISAK